MKSNPIVEKQKQFFVEQDNLNVEQSAYYPRADSNEFLYYSSYLRINEIRTRGDRKDRCIQ